MNELEFKRHLKDLVHGHHHPEEHDWAENPVSRSGKQERTTVRPTASRKRAKKSSKKK
jgi:hypothetical protein